MPATNQLAELNNKRSNSIKEVIVAPPTSDELKMLDTLRELKGWRYAEADDLAWLRDFIQEVPGFAITELRAVRDYYSGRPPTKHKGIWKNRLRNWMIKAREFQLKENERGGHGGTRSQRPRAVKKHGEYLSPEEWAKRGI